MPKTDINTILKEGNKTLIEVVDYSSEKKINELKLIKKKSEQSMNNKWQNHHRLSKMFLNNKPRLISGACCMLSKKRKVVALQHQDTK